MKWKIQNRKNMKLLFQCPVCLNYSLEEPAYLNGVGSDEICYICGFQFGLDFSLKYDENNMATKKVTNSNELY